MLCAPDVLQAAREFVCTDAERLECTAALDTLNAVVHRGTSAHRQLKIYNEARTAGASRADALREVLTWLAVATVQKYPAAALGAADAAMLRAIESG